MKEIKKTAQQHNLLLLIFVYAVCFSILSGMFFFLSARLAESNINPKEQEFAKDSEQYTEKLREEVTNVLSNFNGVEKIAASTAKLQASTVIMSPIPTDILKQLLDLRPAILRLGNIDRLTLDTIEAWKKELKATNPKLTNRNLLVRELNQEGAFKKLSGHQVYNIISSLYPIQHSQELIGLDITPHKIHSQALRNALETGNIAVAPGGLVSAETLADTTLITLYYTIYEPLDPASEATAKPKGFIFTSISLQLLLDTISEIQNKPLNVTISNLQGPGISSEIIASASYSYKDSDMKSAALPSPLMHQDTIRIGNVHFRVTITPASDYYENKSPNAQDKIKYLALLFYAACSIFITGYFRQKYRF